MARDPKLAPVFPELVGCALVRELHVYGQLESVVVDGDASNDNGNNKSGEQQHVGFGRQLMAEAERLSARAGYSKVAVIAGVGVRNYYRSRLGYRLSPGPGEFMVKDLSPAFRLRHHRFLGGALGAAAGLLLAALRFVVARGLAPLAPLAPLGSRLGWRAATATNPRGRGGVNGTLDGNLSRRQRKERQRQRKQERRRQQQQQQGQGQGQQGTTGSEQEEEEGAAGEDHSEMGGGRATAFAFAGRRALPYYALAAVVLLLAVVVVHARVPWLAELTSRGMYV